MDKLDTIPISEKTSETGTIEMDADGKAKLPGRPPGPGVALESRGIGLLPDTWAELREFRAWKSEHTDLPVSMNAAIGWLLRDALTRWRKENPDG